MYYVTPTPMGIDTSGSKQQDVTLNFFDRETPAIRLTTSSLVQYIPLNTGFVRQMLAPYSSYSAFVWQACDGTRNYKSSITKEIVCLFEKALSEKELIAHAGFTRGRVRRYGQT